MNRQQDLFEIDIFYNIINVFTVSFELILDDKSIFIFLNQSISLADPKFWTGVYNVM